MEQKMEEVVRSSELREMQRKIVSTTALWFRGSGWRALSGSAAASRVARARLSDREGLGGSGRFGLAISDAGRDTARQRRFDGGRAAPMLASGSSRREARGWPWHGAQAARVQETRTGRAGTGGGAVNGAAGGGGESSG